jgi:hypothetical protein
MGPSATDKRGSFTVDTLRAGEYAFGIYDFTVGVPAFSTASFNELMVYPNPSGDTFTINIPGQSINTGFLTVFDNGGRIVKQFTNCKPGDVVIWDPQQLPQGIYIVKFSGDDFSDKSRMLLFTH